MDKKKVKKGRERKKKVREKKNEGKKRRKKEGKKNIKMELVTIVSKKRGKMLFFLRVFLFLFYG